MSSGQEPQPSSVGEALEYLGRTSLREESIEGLLQRVADLTRTLMPGAAETSVTLLVQERPSTVAATGQLAVDLDESQYERGHGPCLHAAATGEIAEIPDTRNENRWPDFAQQAADRGNLSTLSVPLAADEPPLSGSLNIYARQANFFDAASRSTATHIAGVAAAATGNLSLYRSALKRAANLEAAMASRAVIEQAKGILMERHKVTADVAFHLLARASMHTHIKVRILADQLILTGELPSR